MATLAERLLEKEKQQTKTTPLAQRLLAKESQNTPPAQATAVREVKPVSDLREKLNSGTLQGAKNTQFQQTMDNTPALVQSVKEGKIVAPAKENDGANWGRVALGTLLKGADQAASGFTATGAWLENTLQKGMGLVLGDDQFAEQDGLLELLNKRIQKAKETNEEYFAEDFKEAGKVGEALDKYGTATVAAVPQAIVSIMAAPQMAAAKFTTSALQSASALANSGLAQSIGSAVTGMAKNPQYWLSFIQGAGNDYEQAKADGANEMQATAYAALSNLVNAAIEMGGGIQTLPAELQSAAAGGKAALRMWVEGMLDEGKEEVVQGAISQMMQTLTYGKDNPLYSTTDPNAVVNPGRMAEEFMGGAVVGGVLGGGQIGLSEIMRRVDAQAQKNTASTGETAINDDPAQHTPQEQAVIEAYKQSSDQKLRAFIEKVRTLQSNDYRNKIRTTIDTVTTRAAEKAAELTGVDTSGYTTIIKGNSIQHIDKRHGARGKADNSMANIEDFSRIGFVLDNFTDAQIVTENDMDSETAKLAKEWMNSDNTRAQMVRFSMPVNGTYYVVEAIPDSNAKNMAVISAYMTNGIKKGSSLNHVLNMNQGTNAQSPQRTPAAPHEMLGTSKTTVSHTGPVVKPQNNAAGALESAGSPPAPGGAENAVQPPSNLNEGGSNSSVGAADAGFDPVQKLVDRYGAMPEGEGPVTSDRVVQVPAQTSDGQRVSQSVRNAMEAEALPNETAEMVEKAMVEEAFSDVRKSNEAAVAAAEEKIGRIGWQDALNGFFSDIRNGRTSSEITAMGWTLFNHAANAGDGKTAVQILVAISRNSRNTAQSLQANRVFKRMTPAGQLYGIQQSVESLQQELLEKYGDMAPELTIPDDLAQAFLDAKTDADRETAANAIYQKIAEQVPSTWTDKLNAWRYTAMLTNPTTHVRNIVGNLAAAIQRNVKNLVGATLEKVFVRDVQQRTKSVLGFDKNDRELRKYAASQYAQDRNATLGSGKYSEQQRGSREIQDRRRIFENALLEGIRKKNAGALEWEDARLFGQPTYVQSFAQALKAKGVTAEDIAAGRKRDLVESARAYAVEEARKATYRDTNAFSKWVSDKARAVEATAEDTRATRAVKRGLNLVVEGLLPFKKTPANILARGMEYSPVGLVSTLTLGAADLKSGKITPAQFIDHLSAGLSGTGILGLGMWLASMGVLTAKAGGDDDKEQKMLDQMGRQDYALNLPGGTYTLDWLAPTSIPLFTGAAIMEAMADDGFQLEDVLSAMQGMGDVVLETSMLSSLETVLSNISYAENKLGAFATETATSYLGQFVPTLGGRIANMMDDTSRRSYTEAGQGQFGQDVDYFKQAVLKKIPGAKSTLQPYVDLWGNEEKTGEAGQRFLENFLSPGYYEEKDIDPVNEELLRLFEQTGDNGVLPAVAAKYFNVNGERKNLTGEEYAQYAKALGKQRYDLVEKFLSDSDYRSMKDGERADMIDSIYEYSNAIAKMEVSDYTPDDKWIMNAKNARKDLGVSTLDYLKAREKYGSTYLSGAAYEKTKAAVKDGIALEDYLEAKIGIVKHEKASGGNGKISQEEAQAYLDGTKLSREEKSIVWQSINSQWEKNPYAE